MKSLPGCIFGLALLMLAPHALSQGTLSQILTNGPTDKRINIVFLAEGYLQNQTNQFAANARSLLGNLLGTLPFNSYSNYFNAFTIFVASAEAGSDHPDTGVFKNTYFNSSYDSYGIQRLITIPPNSFDGNYANGQGKADALLQSLMPEYDITVLVVNDGEYGGSGGTLAITSVESSAPEIVVHELGHSYAALGDEYDSSYPGYPDTEEPNTTRETIRTSIKWRDWILAVTPIPTPETAPYAAVVGLFQGAHYHFTGWYRPKLDCKMNHLGVTFCEVCSEALVKSTYGLVRPIESNSPPTNAVITLVAPAAVNLMITRLQPAGYDLTAQWFINNLAVSGATNGTFNVVASALLPGANQVRVEVTDPTSKVRTDPLQVLKDRRDWLVTLNPNLAQMVDAPNLTWTTGGSGNWFGQVATTHDGVDAAQSGDIANSQSSYLETTVTGPGTLSFWWKISSEKNTFTGTGYDFLRFTLDGVEQPGAPGIAAEVDWQQRTIPIPPGSHGLRWTYIKDGSDIWPVGLDAGWLDQVVFISSAVTIANDNGPGSLRQTIADVSAGTTITFAPNLSGQTILLTSGELYLTKNVNVDASALPGGITIDGNQAGRIFEVANGATVGLTGLIIANGFADGTVNGSYGGAIQNNGTLIMSQCTLSGNSVSNTEAGGAISSSGTLTLSHCTLTGNSAGYGGAIANYGPGTLTNCTFSLNVAQNNGGAIWNNNSTLVLAHCTVSGNTASFGGALNNYLGTLTMLNSIAAANTAFNGADLYNFGGSTIIRVGANIVQSLLNESGGTNSGPAAINADPLLAALADYGGPTQTMPPLTGSPAIDAAATTPLTTDQRGLPRPLGLAPDIGAVEGVFNSAIPLVSPVLLGNGAFQFAFSNLNGMPFTVLASTNLSLPLSNWIVRGAPIEAPPGQYQFTDAQATNSPQKFYGVAAGQSRFIRWASSVLGYSSAFGTTPPDNWSAAQALGQPNVHPAYGDIFTAWATSNPDDSAEYLELGFDSPAPIRSVSIYETFNPGAVSKVSIRNPNTGLWVPVWSGTAAPAAAVSRIFTVTFAQTSFLVDAVRLDLNSAAVPGWNEIDAVSIHW